MSILNVEVFVDKNEVVYIESVTDSKYLPYARLHQLNRWRLAGLTKKHIEFLCEGLRRKSAIDDRNMSVEELAANY